LGWTLIIFGEFGLIAGIVPFAVHVVRLVADSRFVRGADWSAHGVDALGLSSEWALLSSAMGTYLGALLLWAGIGWTRGRPWAPVVAWAYVFGGLAVNVTDMLIFWLQANPCLGRTLMLIFDGIALALPVAVAVWLLRIRRAGRAGP